MSDVVQCELGDPCDVCHGEKYVDRGCRRDPVRDLDEPCLHACEKCHGIGFKLVPIGRVRDPARIDRMLALLAEYWKEAPDLRLVQILINHCHANEKPYYVEDSVMEERLRESLVGGQSGGDCADKSVVSLRIETEEP